MSLVQIFTIAGVAVFAASSALAAGRRSLDPVGVLVLALVTATGGGTLRDVLMDRYPIFWIADPSVFGVSAITGCAGGLAARHFLSREMARQAQSTGFP